MAFEDYMNIGAQIYSELIKYNGNIQFVICPCSLGDTVNIGVFISTYKRVHGYDKVILVVKSHQIPLAGIFSGVDAVFELSDEEMIGLRFYITINKLEKCNNVLYGYFQMEDNSIWETKNNKFLNFVDEYKSQVLEIPLDSEMDSINYKKTEKNRFLNDVLLVPHCQSGWKCSDLFWNELVKYFREHGVREIYTNVGNANDYAIEGTTPLKLPVPELLACSGQFKKIIGIRGGIFDVLALRDDVKLDVIYPGIVETFLGGKCEIDTKRHPLYFGLKNLNSNAKVREYLYSDKCEKYLVEELTNEEVSY